MTSTLPAVPSTHTHREATKFNPKRHHHHPPPPKPSTWSHRHFPSYHPTANKLLSKRWEEHARQLHLKKLRNAKPTIDNGAPKVYPHLEMRLKRLQIEQERLFEIERSNHILLDRIAFQMENSSEVSELHHPGSQHVPGAGSLHGPKRKRELKEIASQNLTILQRIEDKPPNYNRLAWLQDRCRNLEYLRNIAQYPETYHRLLDDHESSLSKLVPQHQQEQKKKSISHRPSVAEIKVPEKELPPPGENLPIGRPPTRPNRMSGFLSDSESENASLASAEVGMTENQEKGTSQQEESAEGHTAKDVEDYRKEEERPESARTSQDERVNDDGRSASSVKVPIENFPNETIATTPLHASPSTGDNVRSRPTSGTFKDPLPPINSKGTSPAVSGRASRPGTAGRV